MLLGERNATSSQFALQQVRNVKFPCPKCSSVFNRKNNLQKHLKYECGQLPRFKCPYCEYRSKKTSNVRTHVRSIHFGCNVYVIDLKSDAINCLWILFWNALDIGIYRFRCRLYFGFEIQIFCMLVNKIFLNCSIGFVIINCNHRKFPNVSTRDIPIRPDHFRITWHLPTKLRTFRIPI